ncbi:MAG: wax ester/triacylglycerol synthase family O-acyltransferase [Sandaracinaceae bacterium]|nr:wax ester/triacylglycerol synthase family O-acyltransferase [Sandaracinaceae bacterium]
MADIERLSALDAAFLAAERGGAHMHIGALATFEGGPLVGPDGGVDFARVRAHVEGWLERLPRYRQRITSIPMLSRRVWSDDPHFRLDYHVRHAALPRPGDLRQLKRLAGRIFGQRLDRERPLWELWVIEGLDGGGFAMVLKTHHCLVDGIGGVELLGALFGAESQARERFAPQPAPSPRALVGAELDERAKNAVRRAQELARLAAHPAEAVGAARDVAREAAALVMDGLTPCDRTSLNPDAIGPHRRFDVVRHDLEEVKAIKRALGGKLNDVVLATAAGALGRTLARRGTHPAVLTDFRALVPVDVRHGRGGVGNRVGMMFARLPLAEADPIARHRAVLAQTEHVKHTAAHAQTTELIEDLSDELFPSIVAAVFTYAARAGTFNVVITNVPGPPFPMALLGSRLTALYPLVPLFESQALGIALFSYDGALHWGLNADWGAMPDLHLFADDLRASFDELRDAARA